MNTHSEAPMLRKYRNSLPQGGSLSLELTWTPPLAAEDKQDIIDFIAIFLRQLDGIDAQQAQQTGEQAIRALKGTS